MAEMVLRAGRIGLKPLVVLSLAGVLVAAALAGPLVVPYDPVATNAPAALQPPSAAHWFGTDQLGRDIYSRTLAATRIDLTMAFAAVAGSLLLGSLLGGLAGWMGSWVDAVVTRLLDTIMAFPLFVLAVGIAAAMGNSVQSVIIATVVVNLPFYARQTRTEVNRRRSAGYVEAALLAGVPDWRIVAFHIMPNLVAPLAVQSSLNMGWAILNAAGLSFIGLGIRPPQPEWGIMVADGATYIFSGEWWTFVFPGAALMLAILVFTLLGDTLRDLLDPEARMNAEPRIPLVAIDRLAIAFGGSPTPTLDMTSLALERGEIVALVGESGSGKSLLAYTLAGILTPAATLTAESFSFGGVDLRSRSSPGWRDLRGREIGFVFQNPRGALSPVRRVGDQIADVIAEHRGLRGKALRAAVLAALADVRIPDPERRRAYPGELSGGMCQRIMIAIALAGNPALLIADEPTTGLDTTTQAAILELIAAAAAGRRMACLLITHDLALARRHARRVIVMHAGQMVEDGETESLCGKPRHPYTAALFAATPVNAPTVHELQGIAGAFPDLRGAVPACRFAGRCARALPVCAAERPLLAGSPSHRAACWNPLP